ncbi:MAG TPA: BTAD domain-containing putative transcriptional regulator [Actinomycetota bacterium]
MVRIRLLGRFAVRIGEQVVPKERFGGRRTRSLVAFLATRRGTLVPKDLLVEALWGEREPADPFGNLDVLASRARRALGSPALIEAASGGLLLVDDERVDVDAEQFAAAVERGRNYLAAEQTGPALAAFQEALSMWDDPLPEETYSEWASPFRREMASHRLQAMEAGARAALALGNAPSAVGLASGAVAAEPLRETATLLLVTALGLGGDQVGALQAFDRYRVALREELGLDPSPDAYEVQSRILRGVKQTTDAALGRLLPEGIAGDPRAALGRRGSGPMRARTLASMAMFAAGSDDYGRAAELSELALQEAGDDQRALAEALYVASIVDMNLGQLARAEQRADEALGHFELLGDDEGVANILDGKAMATFMAGRIADGVAAFDRVARLFTDAHDLARVVTPRSTKGHGMIFMCRPADGLVEIDEALRIAVSLGEREGEAYARWHRSEALAALGRADEAVESAAASLAIAEELVHREWTAAALRAVGIARRAAGDRAGAEDASRRGIVASEGIPLFETWHAAGLARTLLDDGRVSEAREWAARAVGGGPPLGLFEARLADVLVAAASGEARAPELADALWKDAEAGGHLAVIHELKSVRAH